MYNGLLILLLHVLRRKGCEISMLISHINPRPSSTRMKRGDGSIEMTNKRKNCKRREMVMSIMIYDEMTDKVG